MQEDVIRYIKRIAILIPGLAIATFAVKDIYPFIDRRIPDTLAVLVLYMLVAYVLIPAFFRLFRVLFKAKHVPLYSTTPDGLASDPVNIGIIGTRLELINAMSAAGWHTADRRSLKTVTKMGFSLLLNKHYHTAPFSSLYLFGRKQDIGFQKVIADNPRHRHHVRFWASDDPSAKGHHKEHVSFWQPYHKSLSTDRKLWIGAASLDMGIGIVRHTGQFTHMVHHDTNKERDYIIDELQKSGLITHTKSVKVGEPYRLLNRARTLSSGYFMADGKMTICELADSSPHQKS